MSKQRFDIPHFQDHNTNTTSFGAALEGRLWLANVKPEYVPIKDELVFSGEHLYRGMGGGIPISEHVPLI